MSWTLKSRPADPVEEWDLSRQDRRQELVEIGGLAGVRELRSRLARVSKLKSAVGGYTLTAAQLDAVFGPPVRRGRDWRRSNPQ